MLAACPSPGVEHSVKQSNSQLDLCKADLGHHNLEAAKSECDRSIAHNHENDEAYLVRGLIALTHAYDDEQTLEIESCLTGLDAEATHKDMDAALKTADGDLETATKISPEYGEAWADRGVVQDLLGNYAQAEEFNSKALGLPARLGNPTITRANLGWAFFHETKLVDAARELRAALQFQPKMCVATYRLGRVYFARGEWDKAADYFQTTSDDASCGLQEASLYLMKTKLQQGLVNDARLARDACLSRSPKSCAAEQCRADGGALGPAEALPPQPPGTP
jgi:tetratricopeptide (TPR) repeat protein